MAIFVCICWCAELFISIVIYIHEYYRNIHILSITNHTIHDS